MATSTNVASNPNYAVVIHQSLVGGSVVDIIGSLPETVRMGLSSEWEAPLANGILGMLPGSINGLLRMYGVKPATQSMTLEVWQGSKFDDMSVDMVFTTYSDPVKDIREPLLALLKMCTPSVDTNGAIVSPGPSLDPQAAGQLVVSALSSVSSIADTAAPLVGQVAGALAATAASTFNTKDYSKTLDSASQAVSKGASNNWQANVPKAEGANGIKSKIRNSISMRIGNFLYFDQVVITNVAPDCDLMFLDGKTSYPNVVHATVSFRPLFMTVASDWDNILINPGS